MQAYTVALLVGSTARLVTISLGSPEVAFQERPASAVLKTPREVAA
jgi:hypothetical protein